MAIPRGAVLLCRSAVTMESWALLCPAFPTADSPPWSGGSNSYIGGATRLPCSCAALRVARTGGKVKSKEHHPLMGQLRLGLTKFRSLDLTGLCCALPHFQIGCHVSCQRQAKNRMVTSFHKTSRTRGQDVHSSLRRKDAVRLCLGVAI